MTDTSTPCTCADARRAVAAALRGATHPCPVHAGPPAVEAPATSALNDDRLQAALIAKLQIPTTTQEN